MKEIPQDLAQRMAFLMRQAILLNRWNKEDAYAVLKELDFLDQPPDPVEVAGNQIDEYLKTHGWCAQLGPWPIPMAKDIIRQAYAQREEAARALVEHNYVKDHAKAIGLSADHVSCTICKRIQNLRTLYPEWDK